MIYPEAFIKGRLSALQMPSEAAQPTSSPEAEIKRLLLSKKFRKYSVQPVLMQHIESVIAKSVKDGTPINLTFLNGAYKLWRLEASPYPDWAELFTLMYYTKWLKPICELYEPGVQFDFYMDDWIVPRLDYIPASDVSTYIDAFNSLLEFMKEYQPKNLRMTLTPVSTQFPPDATFEEELNRELKALSDGVRPEISEKERAMIELNAKLTPEITADPLWAEKISITHSLYLKKKREQGYHFAPGKILVFTQPLPSGMVLAVGTTKTSVAKFWVGTGALKRRDDSYIETILSPEQGESLKSTVEEVEIGGLGGSNFSKIRVIDEPLPSPV